VSLVQSLHAPPVGSHKILDSVFAIVAIIIAIAGLSAVSIGIQNGTIEGRVEDNHGNAVAWATVDVRRLVTGEVSRVRTRADGSFVLPSVTSGKYSLSVQAWGYAPVNVPRVVLGSGEHICREFVISPLQ
jgi:Carboxypeptidase regulatory-like domain